jgi:hypothetical protein
MNDSAIIYTNVTMLAFLLISGTSSVCFFRVLSICFLRIFRELKWIREDLDKIANRDQIPVQD